MTDQISLGKGSSSAHFGGGNKIVGFAVLIEMDGQKMLVFSDDVQQGTFTMHSEIDQLISDDSVIRSFVRRTGYDVTLRGERLNVRVERKNMQDLLTGPVDSHQPKISTKEVWEGEDGY